MTSTGSDPPNFAIDAAARADGITTIRVSGELDLATAGELAAALSAALAAGDVVLDLSAVSFMDSAGVRSLNSALRETAEQGRRLTVRPDMQPIVSQVLELTGMMQLLQITEDAA